MKLFEILSKHKDPIVRGRAVFDTSSLSDSEKLLMESTWENSSDFEVFRIIKNGGEGLRKFVQREDLQ